MSAGSEMMPGEDRTDTYIGLETLLNLEGWSIKNFSAYTGVSTHKIKKIMIGEANHVNSKDIFTICKAMGIYPYEIGYSNKKGKEAAHWTCDPNALRIYAIESAMREMECWEVMENIFSFYASLPEEAQVRILLGEFKKTEYNNLDFTLPSNFRGSPKRGKLPRKAWKTNLYKLRGKVDFGEWGVWIDSLNKNRRKKAWVKPRMRRAKAKNTPKMKEMVLGDD